MPTLWSGRLGGDGGDDAMRALGDSLQFDRRLLTEDILGSRAHVRMLAIAGLIDQVEETAILDALDQVETEMAGGQFTWASSDEDIHTAVERRVTEITTSGAKMHTGRSRNDQVATDLRLFTRNAIDEVVTLARHLQRVLLQAAEDAGAALVPAYTHLQRAQVTTLGHYLLAHGWAIQRDIERLGDCRRRTNISPLGAGAIAGSSLPIDLTVTAEYLGFDGVFANSIDAVGDRDFVAETLFCLALLGVHLSRLGEDFVLWHSSEFGFVTFADRFATGSSMMPQKKNPDVAELVRAKAGRMIGNLTGLMVALKGLPSGYSKDLQEDKEPLFDSVDTVIRSIPALSGAIATATFHTERMAQAASDPLLGATDLAEWLVAKGVPFREAHGIVAGLVERSMAGDQTFAELVAASPHFGDDAVDLFERAGARHITPGSGSPGDLKTQMSRFRDIIGGA